MICEQVGLSFRRVFSVGELYLDREISGKALRLIVVQKDMTKFVSDNQTLLRVAFLKPMPDTTFDAEFERGTKLDKRGG